MKANRPFIPPFSHESEKGGIAGWLLWPDWTKKIRFFGELIPKPANMKAALHTKVVSMISRSLLILVFTIIMGCSACCNACIALAIDSKGNPYPVPLINAEQAVVIWDEAHKTEHFIRQAEITTSGSHVGFIVPTPQTPELVEVNPSIFDMANENAAPRGIPQTIHLTPLDYIKSVTTLFQIRSVFTTISSQLAMAFAGPSNVEVIHEQDIADYHATVLAADAATSLSQWLKENGYAWNDSDTAWLQPYLKAKWKITAFKLLQKPYEKGTGAIQSHAIRMSFPTDHPFFPYSEPSDARLYQKPNPNSRVLTVAVLCDRRMIGKLDDGHVWPAKLKYSGDMRPPFPVSEFLIAAKLDKATTTIPTRLTYFRDESNPRPGTADLLFSPDPDQSTYQETYVDSYLPPLYVMDWNQPVADIEALLILFAFGTAITSMAWLFKRTQDSNKFQSL